MKFLRGELYKKGYTQEEFAAKIGVTQETVSNWVNGKQLPRAKYLNEICRFLDLTKEEFLKGVNFLKE